MRDATNRSGTPAWRRYLTFWRTPIVQDVDDELRFHTSMRVKEYMARGMSEDDARRSVAERLGDVPAARAECIELGCVRERNAHAAGIVDDLLQDVRFAGRQFRRNPGFAALAIVTLASGIGANTAIFSVVHHVLLDPLPFPDGNRIVALGTGPERETRTPFQFMFGVRTSIVRRLEAESRTVTEVSGMDHPPAVIATGGQPDTVGGAAITASFLPMLRVRMAIGRGFGLQDTRRGAPPVVMIGYGLWQTRYGGARDVLGKTVTVNSVRRTIIGVTPVGLNAPILVHGGDPPEIWLPLDLDSIDAVDFVFARLRPDATSASAAAELQSYFVQSPEAAENKGYREYAATALDLTAPAERQAIEILFLTVCGLLLIACANLANLLFMRGWARQRELAVRRALGAGRPRLVRQLLTESLALSIAGGASGLVVGWLGLRLFAGRFQSQGIFSDLDLSGLHADGTVLGWTVGLTFATGLLFGIGPALWSGSGSTSDALRAGSRGIAGNAIARYVRASLVIGEIGLSLSFLIAAALLVRSFVALERAPIGLDPRGLVTIDIRLTREPAPENRRMLERTIIRALDAVPGVTGAAFGSELAVINVVPGPFAVEGPSGLRVAELGLCQSPLVSAEYFKVAGVPILQGRTFDEDDRAASSTEVIVNKSLAQRLWPGGHALGARVRLGSGARAEWLTVVGIAGDVHLPGVDGDLFNLKMYRPPSTAPHFSGLVAVRTNGRAGPLELLLKQAVERAGVSARLGQVWRSEAVIDARVLNQPRFALTIFGIFAVIALALSAVGLYGVIAYAVTQRTREIGIRVTLGADPNAVARLILGDGGVLIAIGAGFGLLIAYMATRALTAFLYGILPTDPAAYLGATVLLVLVALAASLVPTRRALRIDPIEALRTE